MQYLLFLMMFIALLCVSYVVLGPPGQLRRQFRREARVSYALSRGTAHLRLLTAARVRWSARVQAAQSNLNAADAEAVRLARERDIALRRKLEVLLARSQLDELPGLGPKLTRDLVALVDYRGLAALRDAERVSGIGPARAAAIRRWLAQVEPTVPSRLKLDFDGKSAICASYDKQIAGQQKAVRYAKDAGERAAELLRQVNVACASLSDVTESDFLRALDNPGHKEAALAQYQRGVFGEWEEPPEWFQKAVSEEAAG